MSSELFQGYLLAFCDELNLHEQLKVPEFFDMHISHHLWADDMVFLVLDCESLQNLID